MSTITMTTNLSAATSVTTRKSSRAGLAIAVAAALLAGGMTFAPAWWLGHGGPSTATTAPAASVDSDHASPTKAAEMTDLSLWQLSHPLFRPCSSGFDLVPHIGPRRTTCTANP